MLLQKVRDEAHRFAITFHRNKRSKNTFKTELEDIPGIGRSTTDLLLHKYKSATKVSQVSIAELSELIGQSKATKITDYFKRRRKD